jgi:flagellar protein FliO/FliZ
VDTLLLTARVVLSLAAVLGLLWYVQRRVTKSPRATRSAGLVSVVGRQGIGQKASVVVVDVDGTRFVLGVTEQSVTVLHNAAASNAAASTEAAAGSRPIGVRAVPSAPEHGFAQALADAGASDDVEPPLAFRPRRDRHPAGRGSKLGGSILSPATWQQTAAVLRQGR